MYVLCFVLFCVHFVHVSQQLEKQKTKMNQQWEERTKTAEQR